MVRVSDQGGSPRRRGPAVPPLAGENYVCEVCGIDFARVSVTEAVAVIGSLPRRVREAVSAAPAQLRRSRPHGDRWSVIEYVCHLRDVYATYTIRLYRARTEVRTCAGADAQRPPSTPVSVQRARRRRGARRAERDRSRILRGGGTNGTSGTVWSRGCRVSTAARGGSYAKPCTRGSITSTTSAGQPPRSISTADALRGARLATGSLRAPRRGARAVPRPNHVSGRQPRAALLHQ